MSQIYKVVLLGESGVGKTCIINYFVTKKFDSDFTPSATAQYMTKRIEFPGGKSLKFDIWDTIGQEKFHSLNRLYYNGAKAFILVYDVISRENFNKMKEYWYKEVMGLSNQDVIIAIVESKSDLYKERKVDKIEGEKFAEENGAIFASTSAKKGIGIQDLFDSIGRKILNDDFVIVGNEIKDDYEKSKEINEDGGRESFRLSTKKSKNKNNKKNDCC